MAAKPCGWNDAFHAAFHGDHSALRALRAEALEADTTGLRPIHLAAMRGKCDCAEVLLSIDGDSLEARFLDYPRPRRAHNSPAC